MEFKLFFGNHSAVINTHGAELRSLKLKSDRELMWNGNPDYWGKISPVLFPIVGGLRNNKTIINGKEFSITKHGFARDNEFTYSQIAKNDLVFTFNSNEETLKSYPFKFTLKIHYRLLLNRLKIEYTVTNNDETDMPFCIGSHPAFSCPFDNKSKFSDYKLIFEKPENVDYPVFDEELQLFSSDNKIKGLHNETNLKLSYEAFINDCIYLNKLNSKSVLLTRDNRTGIKTEWLGFDTLGIWTPPGLNAPFVCIEPWCGSADFTNDKGIFNEKKGVQTAKPNETLKYQLIISEIN